MWSKREDKEVVFFDLGNTLISFHTKGSEKEKEELGEHYLYLYLNDRFPKVNEDNLRVGFLEPWTKLLKQRSQTHEEYPIEPLLNGYLKEYGGELTHQECVDAIRCFYRPFLDKMEKEKHLYDTLKTLKDHGYRLAILANTPYFKEVMMECLDEAEIGELFEEAIFSYEVGMAKPKREIFEYALKKMNVSGDEAIMVGDSLLNDMANASAVGMECYWLNKKLEDNYLEISNVSEIKELSELLNCLLVNDGNDTTSYFEVEEVDEDDDFNVNDYLFDEEE